MVLNDIYRKETHTGQYSHFSSFESFYRKTAWVKSLLPPRFLKFAVQIKSILNNQIEIIKSFMPWNIWLSQKRSKRFDEKT